MKYCGESEVENPWLGSLPYLVDSWDTANVIHPIKWDGETRLTLKWPHKLKIFYEIDSSSICIEIFFHWKSSIVSVCPFHCFCQCYVTLHFFTEIECSTSISLRKDSTITTANQNGINLCPGLNFINILHTAFRRTDPKSVKRYWWLNCIFLRFWDLRA